MKWHYYFIEHPRLRSRNERLQQKESTKIVLVFSFFMRSLFAIFAAIIIGYYVSDSIACEEQSCNTLQIQKQQHIHTSRTSLQQWIKRW